jgi:adenosylmethionine-8-amino-7-oxononanoate aminotransferase
MVNTKRIIELDKKYVWHPFTQMADWASGVPSPVLAIERASGNCLYDTSGKKYIDGVSSMWANLLGHNNKRLNNAVKKQLSKVAHSTFLGLTHVSAVQLAKELALILPEGLERVFYSDNGSTAVEVAVKMAFQYWQHKGKERNIFISLENAYHGDTLGAVSVGGVDLFHKAYKPLLFKTIKAMSPYCYRCEYNKGQGVRGKGKPAPLPVGRNVLFTIYCGLTGCKGECVKHFEGLVKKHHKNVAACIVEPMIQAAGGMITMPPGYLRELDRIRKRYRLLLICDEVATGFGRTGRMFACEHEKINPDFICLSKGITGGYLPLAVTVTTDKIYKAFLGKYEDFKTFFHGHTYTANPLACALSLEVLKILVLENVVVKIQPKIALLRNELSKLSSLKNVGDIRQIGLMAGIEIVKQKNPIKDFEPKLKIGQKVCAKCREQGLIVRPLGNTVVLMPPLTIKNQEIIKMVGALKLVLSNGIS